MTDLPPPPVEADVDLTAFPFMPLNVRRLRDSRFAASADPEAFRTGVLLWCAAWHQVPAGSLPDDDIQLATLAGFGRAVSDWQKVRDGALYGWSKCSDGRLYHRVLVQAVLEAWSRREDWQEQRANDEDRKTRYRDRLKELSAELRALGVAIPKNRSLEVLEQLLADTKRGRSGDTSGDAPGTQENLGFETPGTPPGTQRGHSGDSGDIRGRSGDVPGTVENSVFSAEKESAGTFAGTLRGRAGTAGTLRGFSGDTAGMAKKGTGKGQGEDIKNPLSPLEGGMNGASAPRRPRQIRERGRQAWERVLEAAQSGRSTVGDDQIDAAVRQMGGYRRIGEAHVAQRAENRTRFRELYEQLLDRQPGEEG